MLGWTPAALTADQSRISDAPVYYASAEQDRLWTVYERARTFDADYLAAQSRYESDSEQVNAARSQLLPSLDITAERLETDQDIVAADNDVFAQGKTRYSTNRYGAYLTQTVFDWGRFQTFSQAKQKVLLAESDLLIAEQELILRAVERYLLVLAAEDNVRFSQLEEDAMLEQQRAAEARYNARLVRESDLLEAKARAAAVFADRVRAEADLADAREGLREISGAGAQRYARLKEELDVGDPEPNVVTEWILRSHSQNTRVRRQRIAVSVADKEVRRQRSGHYPTLDLVGRFDYEDVDGSLFGGGSEVETADIALQFRLPIYQGGGVSTSVRRAMADLDTEGELLQKEIRLAAREARAAFVDLGTARTRIDSLATAVQAQQVVVETKRRGYPRLNTNREVLDAERDLYAVERDLAKARYDYILADLRLKQAGGVLESEDVRSLDDLFQ